MSQDWKSYEKAAERGPLAFTMKVLGLVFIVGLATTAIGIVLGTVNETATVAHEELGPRALLTKYTWFKEAAAQLDQKRANIGVYEARIKVMQTIYANVPRQKWPREDREQLNVWASEVAGAKASFNSLAAEYNAKMAEIHWRFTNVGDLPQGAAEPLPRDFKPYVTE